ncbi:hypothetical protein PENSPDRAFT_648314 [Peniophora sp. CONT]|nr:hypothetical protein PENSPDRAFT_648314 [Peniophora sp. CONT]
MPPPRKPEPTHILSFATNSLRNTTISVDDDTIFYEVVTRWWHPTVTKIFKLDKEARQMLIVGEIEREPGREPRVRVGGEHGNWITLDEFVRWDPDMRSGTWATSDGNEYRWQCHKRRLQLVKGNDDEATPIARYIPYTRHFFVLLMDRHAALEVKDEALGYMDQLIMSYLIVERKRRDQRIRVTIGRS